MIKYKLVAIFEHKKVGYSIVIINDKINFLKYSNGYLTNELSNEDLKILFEVHNSLTINKKTSVFVKYENINKKRFQIWYDITTGLHFWYEIDGTKKGYGTENDNIILNNKYNKVPEFMFDRVNNNQDESKVNHKKQECKDKFFRCVSTVLACANILVWSGITFAKYCDIKLIEELKGKIIQNNEILEEVETKKYSFDDFENTLQKNTYLSEEEKKRILDLKEFFYDNKDYIDWNEVILRLAYLKINYKNENKGEIKGIYDSGDNYIDIYESTSFEDADIRIWVHELLHVFQVGREGGLVYELSNEITTREAVRYLYDNNKISNPEILNNDKNYPILFGKAYRCQIPLYYCICDLLPEEAIRKYEFTPKISILMEELVKIDCGLGVEAQIDIEDEEFVNNHPEEIKNAIDLIDSFAIFYDEDGNIVFSTKKDKEIYEKIDRYYQIKNGNSMEMSCNKAYMYLDCENDIGFSRFFDKNQAIQKTINILEGNEENNNKKYTTFVYPKSYFMQNGRYEYPIISYRKILDDGTQEYKEFKLDNEFNKMYLEEYTERIKLKEIYR